MESVDAFPSKVAPGAPGATTDGAVNDAVGLSTVTCRLTESAWPSLLVTINVTL